MTAASEPAPGNHDVASGGEALSSSDARPSPPQRSRFIGIMLVVGVLVIAVAGFGRFLIERATDPANDDQTALPRPKLNAPFITSDNRVVDKMVELAELTEDDLVYDLGCGDGRIVISAALQRGCRGVGFDLDPERVMEARANVEAAGLGERVTIEEANVFDVDLSEAQVVMMYLLPWMLRDLKPQFAQMADGSRLLTHDFPIEGVAPDAVVDVLLDDPHDRHVVYVYTTPLKLDPSYKL